MSNPQISVIIPVYNGQATLQQCLDSVLDQTYDNYELIVVDNNSSDNTKQIIQDFAAKDQRIKYVFEKKQSRGTARNTGVKNSQGDIIAMTDSDCVVSKDWLEIISKPIREQAELIVQGNDSDIIGNYWTNMEQKFRQEFIARQIYENKYINYLDTKNFCINKQVLKNLNLFNTNIKNLEDYELKIRIIKENYKIFFLADLYVDHYHKSSLSSLARRRIDRAYWVTNIYYLHQDFFDKSHEETIAAIKFKNFIIFFPSIIFLFFKKDFKIAWFELVTGLAWRIGIIKGIIKNKFTKNYV